MRRCVAILAISSALASIGAPGPHAQTAADRPEQPRDSGLTERTGIVLQFLDVDIVDAEGNPIRGLTQDDFEVWIDGRAVDIYSVDDLCECPTTTTTTPTANATVPPDPGAAGAEPAVSDLPDAPASMPQRRTERVRYVLYFDFSQLQLDGRSLALNEARRWIAESLPQGGEALLAGYHSIAGVLELSPLTSDRAVLIEALTAAFDDPALLDSFPVRFKERVESCPRCCQACSGPCASCCADECINNPHREYEHGRRAYQALQSFLETLEPLPGRKALLLFHQNSIRSPERYYPLVEEFAIGTHDTLLEEIGAEATQSRTAIYPAFVGNHLDSTSPSGQAVNIGANLASFTGGRYSRGESTLTRLMDELAEHCACLYRIAIVPERDAADRVHRVRIAARGVNVPFRYRLRFLNETDRWWRAARAVLRNPAAADEIAVEVALLPGARSRRGWELTAQVSLDPASLMLLPTAGEQLGHWEVGALLQRKEGEAREMLGVSRLRTGLDVPRSAAIVHERTFSQMRGGRYRLRAFVRDRTANAFGGGAAVLELPPPGEVGMVGPIGRMSGRVLWSTELPLRTGRNAAAESRTLRPTLGTVPESGHPLKPGQRLALLTWICPAAPDSGGSVVRYVSRDRQPLFRFETANLKPAGDCGALEDRIDTGPLEPGMYVYHVRWRRQPEEPPIDGAFEFVVGEAGPAARATRPLAAPESTDPRLPALLDALAGVADRYSDNALRFTCDETISARSDAMRSRHRFRYVYVNEDDQLLDYRVPRVRSGNDSIARARAVRLEDLELPAYLLRAYSWAMALFAPTRQTVYVYELKGDEEILGRPAYVLSFDPVPPYVEDVNDWFGTAWVDRETHQPLRVRAYNIRDWNSVQAFERREAGSVNGAGSYGTWQRFETEFGAPERGMRFPSLVEIRGLVYGSPNSPEGSTRELYRVTHSYDNYRFFAVYADPMPAEQPE